MNIIKSGILFAVLLIPLLAVGEDTQQLFNAKDLTGWKHVGSGRFIDNQ